jgi:hypothetical protein
MGNIVGEWGQVITSSQLMLIVVASILFAYFHCLVICHSYHTKSKREPRPFPTWPIIGNLPLLGKSPYLFLYKLSKTCGDIMELKLGSICTLAISLAKLAQEVFKTHDLVFASSKLHCFTFP